MPDEKKEEPPAEGATGEGAAAEGAAAEGAAAKPAKPEKKKTKKELKAEAEAEAAAAAKAAGPVFTEEQHAANELAFTELIAAMAPEPLDIQDEELEIAIVHAEEADFGMNLLGEPIAQAKKKAKDAIVQKATKRLDEAKASGDIPAIRDEIDHATAAGLSDKIIQGAHLALLEAMTDFEPLEMDWEEAQAQVKISEKAKVAKAAMKNIKAKIDEAKKMQARREEAFNTIIELLAVHDLEIDVGELEAAVKEGEAAHVDEFTMQDAHHKVEESLAAQKLKQTVDGSYMLADIRDVDLTVLANVIEEAQAAGVEKKALDQAVNR